MKIKPIKLIPIVQPHEGGKPYDWGEKGPNSYIARLLSITNAPSNQSFAELWMGMHPQGESTIEVEGKDVPLSEFIANNPVEILGKAVARKYHNELPFLFKVLSAAEILSIQVHPNKIQATALRHEDPEHYPDANHKPEMAVVLDELSVLAGLKNKQEINDLPNKYPELLTIMDQSIFTLSPKEAFVTIIESGTSQPTLVTKTISNIAARLKSSDITSAQEKIFLKLFKTTPDDIGLLSVFFLNHYLLTENQAMFTPSGMPHAYVRGNIIECMTNSDMVIRVGPTPKFRDVRALREVVTDAQPLIFDIANGNYSFSTPAEEFCVHKYELETNSSIDSLSGSARILLVVSGEIILEGKVYGHGSSFLIPASSGKITINCTQSSKFFIVDTPIR